MEDAARRALAAQLGFEIEPATFAAVREHAPSIAEVSAERIRDELLKIFAHHMPPLDWICCESGLLGEVLPELAATIGCEQLPEFHPEDVYMHIRLMLSQLPEDADTGLIWSVLMHAIAKPVTASRDDDGRIRFLAMKNQTDLARATSSGCVSMWRLMP